MKKNKILSFEKQYLTIFNIDNPILELAHAKHDVSNEKRDERGRWTNSAVIGHIKRNKKKYIAAASVAALEGVLRIPIIRRNLHMRALKKVYGENLYPNINNLKYKLPDLFNHLQKSHNKLSFLDKILLTRYQFNVLALNKLQNKLRNKKKLNIREGLLYRRLQKAIKSSGKFPYSRSILTYRGNRYSLKDAENLLKKFESKKYVRFKGLTSSSLNHKWAEVFAAPQDWTISHSTHGHTNHDDSHGIMFYIKTKSGLYGGDTTNNMEEIIHHHGKKFRVNGVKRATRPMENSIVHLEEV